MLGCHVFPQATGAACAVLERIKMQGCGSISGKAVTAFHCGMVACLCPRTFLVWYPNCGNDTDPISTRSGCVLDICWMPGGIKVL